VPGTLLPAPSRGRHGQQRDGGRRGAATGGAGTTVAATGVGGAGSSTNTGAGAGPTVCEYPAGPYGVDSGQVLPPTLSWTGFAPGSSAASTFTAEDLFDCDGSRGITIENVGSGAT